MRRINIIEPTLGTAAGRADVEEEEGFVAPEGLVGEILREAAEDAEGDGEEGGPEPTMTERGAARRDFVLPGNWKRSGHPFLIVGLAGGGTQKKSMGIETRPASGAAKQKYRELSTIV